jgi:radical SAM superfamily enzyme YgiQ (UPF0313 family)
MKVMLLSPPYIREYMRNARCDFVSLSASQWYPILLGYCAAYLESRGHTVKLIDAPAYGLSHKQTEQIYLAFKPDVLVAYTGRLSEDNDTEFCDRLIEKHGVRGIFAGPYFSVDPEKTLRKSKKISHGVRGEFEHPAGEFIEGADSSSIKNLVWKNGGQIQFNQSRPYLDQSQLDALPFVSDFFSRHLNARYYRTPSEPYPFMDIMTGRGCKWGRCTYCLWPHTFVKGSVYNTRSIGNVIEEFKFIELRMPQIRSVMIQDDTFTESRASEFCDAKIRAGLKIKWSCYVRADIGPETLKLMQKAGCLNLHVGFESADDLILRNIKKGLSRERMTRFAEDAKKAGLKIHGDFAIGFPGETAETAKKTVAWACKIRPHTAQFQLMIPFPGTLLFKELHEKGYINNGSPDYPHLGRGQMENIAKSAYKSFYISLPFFKQVLKHPYELFFSKLMLYVKAVSAVFWKRYIR